ncbi:MAG: PLP-dependent lyase/thiolase [Actinomycetota bacterium]|nr:PLP-dependent lyase/thiolase [Actinomycetota bacterium]
MPTQQRVHPDDLSPRVVLDHLAVDHRTVVVAREDLLPGGTKQRAISPYLQDAMSRGVTEFVYASPAPGFAQVALAYASRLLGARCTLFCALLDGEFHEFSLLAQSHGATIHPCATLADAEEKAEVFAQGDRLKLPLGFGCSEYHGHLRAALATEWANVVDELGTVPARVWVPVGSATLVTAFRQVVPGNVELHSVDVRVLAETDERIKRLHDLPRTIVYRCEQRFLEESTVQPPVPSNAFYDAKLWPLIEKHAATGDLWWNVAK